MYGSVGTMQKNSECGGGVWCVVCGVQVIFTVLYDGRAAVKAERIGTIPWSTWRVCISVLMIGGRPTEPCNCG